MFTLVLVLVLAGQVSEVNTGVVVENEPSQYGTSSRHIKVTAQGNVQPYYGDGYYYFYLNRDMSISKRGRPRAVVTADRIRVGSTVTTYRGPHYTLEKVVVEFDPFDDVSFQIAFEDSLARWHYWKDFLHDGRIAGLGVPQYAVREEISKWIRSQGVAAIRPLVRARYVKDPEIRMRAKALLESLMEDIVKQEVAKHPPMPKPKHGKGQFGQPL